MAETGGAPGWTVGSLLGVPLGVAVSPTAPSSPPATADSPPRLPASENEGPNWSVEGGEVRLLSNRSPYRSDGVEALDYSNPFNVVMERVWFDGKIVYAIDCGELDVDPDRVKVAQEYQVVYDAALDENGKRAREPERSRASTTSTTQCRAWTSTARSGDSTTYLYRATTRSTRSARRATA